MKISVIIPTRNAEEYMNDLLNKLYNQTKQIDEIIVIDTASKDRTIEICKQFDKVKTIQIKQSEFDHGGTRNLGARNAKGEYIIFLTQDAIPENEYFVENILKPFNDLNVAAVYGRQIAREDATPIERLAREFNYPDYDMVKSKKDIQTLGIKTFFFTDVCSAFRKEDFESVGGFPENIILNEDMIIASRFILRDKLVVYASKAAVIHSHDYTFKQQFSRYFDIGISLKQNQYILEHAKTEKEGSKFIKSSIAYLIKNNKPFWIFNLCIESIAKYIGYKLGLNYEKFSTDTIKKCSMHKFYWDKAQNFNMLKVKDYKVK